MLTEKDDCVSIYIHWPYCEQKCPYCDFNSHVAQLPISFDSWLESYKNEILYYKSITKYSIVKSIFFGGGTPSLMPVKLISDLLDFIKQNWQFHESIEITMEANPSSTEVNNFNQLKESGVNRVSIGVQSFNNKHLKFLGRTHNRSEAVNAIKSADKVFNSYNFDLIYALPNQTILELEQDLNEAIHYLRYHISCYQLTIEPNTVFANYWRYGSYIGIGPGAHGRIYVDGIFSATRNHRSPDLWQKYWKNQILCVDNLKDCHDKVLTINNLSFVEQQEEMLLMGLRLYEGVDIDKFENHYNQSIWKKIDKQRVHDLAKEGMISKNDLNNGIVKIVNQLKINAILGYIICATADY